MKDKIFAKLKQAYSSLGLGDAVLQSQAESLAVTGLVTDENVDAVVAAQKNFLEGLQKAADKRVTDALTVEHDKSGKALAAEKSKWESEMAAKLEAARKEAREQALKDIKPNPEPTPNEPKLELTPWQKAQEERAKQNEELIKALTESNKKLSESLAGLKQENEEAKAKEAAAQRAKFIQDKAKSMGIPSWRIDEGFVISPEADETAITEELTKVANNVKANALPQSRSFVIGGNDSKASAEDVKRIADKLVRK